MKFVQYTNTSIGAVTVDTALPIGVVTQQCMQKNNCEQTFTSGYYGANIVSINETGKYRITYLGSLVAGDAGTLTVSLIVNNETVTSSTVTATSGDAVNIVVESIIRVCNNCSSVTTNFPAQVQLMLGTTAVTGGNSNLIIEQIC